MIAGATESDRTVNRAMVPTSSAATRPLTGSDDSPTSFTSNLHPFVIVQQASISHIYAATTPWAIEMETVRPRLCTDRYTAL